jgi:mono/diheme cytochrome c family protein
VPPLLKGIDVDGKLHRFGEQAGHRASVLIFLATECPISNSFLPVVSSLAGRYKSRGISFYGVISSPQVSRAEALRHRDEYRIPFPVLFDSSGELRRRWQPTHTPQAIVVSSAGQVLYSGRIDDRYVALGRKRNEPRIHDLDAALQAVVKGREVPQPRTEPVGCVLEDLPEETAPPAVTFTRDIAPIIFANCTECHRPGEAAPFPLLSFSDVSRHANQIVEVIRMGYMPPWHPRPGYGVFRDRRGLSEREIALIQQWVAAGKPEGKADDLPPPPRFTPGWQLGQPDLILKMDEEFCIPASGPDIHQHFVLPTGLKHNRLVAAVEFRPGNPRVVHHASFYTDISGSARRLDRDDPQPGYGSFPGAGFDNDSSFRSWLPGMTPRRLPRGTGSLIQAHSDVVLEIHYRPTGKPETDQSTVGVFFAEASARQHVAELQVMNMDLVIPAGEKRYWHRASYTLPAAATLLDAAPHLHLLGREMKATAILPNGETRPLIWITDWDFSWQGQYLYVEPVRLPKGTRIEVDTWFDNSADNPLNPFSPPRDVAWGEQTHDEMAVCHFRYVCDTLPETIAMNNDFRGYVAQQQQRFLNRRQRTLR